jgi:endoglucanase
LKFLTARLPFASPLLLAALVACQATPAPAQTAVPLASTTAPAATGAPATPAPPTPLPAREPARLEALKEQVVLVDQVGYLPSMSKLGLVADASAAAFQVVDLKTSESVLNGNLADATRDDSGQSLRRADFSALSEPGTYALNIPGVGRSPEFRVADDVYQKLNTDVWASYEQLAVLAPKAWQTASVKDRQSGQQLDITGGWPDAGDYGRYMPSAAGTLGTLLLVNDLRGEAPHQDELQVLKRELDWMLKMQRPDGSLYHKLTPLNFGGFDKGADNVGGQLYAFEVSTPDTAAFAAIAASAGRTYRGIDAAYADQLQKAAEAAWAWLERNPKPTLPTEIEGTGAYVYGSDTTQRFWAAAELFRATGDASYGQAVRTYLDKRPASIELLGWSNTTTYALLSLAFNTNADQALRTHIGQLLTRWADGLATTVNSRTNPWAVSISNFHWASNKTMLDNSVLLLAANRLSPNPRYPAAALEQLHFVLGRNALAKSYVTGYGANSVKNPHNRTIYALDRLVPGVLVGGPNGDAQDNVTPAAQGQRSYADELKAYASNENSIEYNAPLAVLTALFAGS